MSREKDRRRTYRRQGTVDETAARRAELAQIHQAKKQLQLDDDTYREVLARVTGVTSSADMTHAQRKAVLAEFMRLGFKPQRSARSFKDRPLDANTVPLLRKVEALLADAKRSWSYAHGLAQKMYSVARLEWLNPKQLHDLVSAMQIDANRRAKRLKE